MTMSTVLISHFDGRDAPITEDTKDTKDTKVKPYNPLEQFLEAARTVSLTGEATRHDIERRDR